MASPSLLLRLGTFSFGIYQKKLQGKPWKNKHSNNFERVMAKAFEEGNLDILFGCEVGGHRLGLGVELIYVQDLAKRFLGPEAQGISSQNYIAVLEWH